MSGLRLVGFVCGVSSCPLQGLGVRLWVLGFLGLMVFPYTLKGLGFRGLGFRGLGFRVKSLNPTQKRGFKMKIKTKPYAKEGLNT